LVLNLIGWDIFIEARPITPHQKYIYLENNGEILELLSRY
jgi:hypothetical protein